MLPLPCAATTPAPLLLEQVVPQMATCKAGLHSPMNLRRQQLLSSPQFTCLSPLPFGQQFKFSRPEHSAQSDISQPVNCTPTQNSHSYYCPLLIVIL